MKGRATRRRRLCREDTEWDRGVQVRGPAGEWVADLAGEWGKAKGVAGAEERVRTAEAGGGGVAWLCPGEAIGPPKAGRFWRDWSSGTMCGVRERKSGVLVRSGRWMSRSAMSFSDG